MKRLRLLVLILGAALLLSACVQPRSSTAHRDALLAPVPDAASGYHAIASAGSGATMGVNFDQLSKDGELTLALAYGIDATASQTPEEGKPETGLSYTGAGDSWQRPIVVHGQAKALTTLISAYRYIADHFPGSRIESSTLYAGPPKSYVARIAFGSNQGDQALYFDLTDWAEAWRKEVPN